ncbi:hypothetical protein [Succinivibrio dextrinosolvens]|uniref:Uncharacterized protein n=1 Tax=Succinivibrio dextrinosolvens TaxID=83771 RepID=A0A662Z605_9GAMM|nr:hypothetical protein [Succinivibrio dextrinosolvens]SFJ75169.1 hypothetical protein SAMN04487865_1001159 [Succinivibrio dextrinosolvens]
MKHLAEYSAKSLYGFFKKEEICFVVEKEFEWIDDTSDVTDDLKEAKLLAKENEAQIFIYKKRLCIDCFYPDTVFQDVLDSLEREGLASELLLDRIGEEGEKEFTEMCKKWFAKHIGKNSWFADELVGVLKDENI